MGGFSSLQPSDFEVDLSSCGVVNTAFAAMFSKLGRHNCGLNVWERVQLAATCCRSVVALRLYKVAQ